MAQCAKFLPNEQRQCKRTVTKGSKFCYQHKRHITRKPAKQIKEPDNANDQASTEHTQVNAMKISEQHLQFLNEKYNHWDTKVDPHALTAQRLLTKKFTHQDLMFQNEKITALTSVIVRIGSENKVLQGDNGLSIMNILNFLHENHELVNEFKGLKPIGNGYILV